MTTLEAFPDRKGTWRTKYRLGPGFFLLLIGLLGAACWAGIFELVWWVLA